MPTQLEPNTKSSDYVAMEPYWLKIEAFHGGIDAMHAAGEKYLPRLQEERKDSRDSAGRKYDAWAQRRNRAPFTNLYDDVVKNLASKPFSKQLTLKDADKAPPAIQDLIENIDGMGNNLHVFCEEVFEAGIDYSFTFIFVDFSRATPRADGLALTKADEVAQKLRPFWTHILPTRMLAIYSDVIDGTEVFTHARISEPTLTLDGFVERRVERMRVLDRQPTAWDEAMKPTAYGPPTWTVFEQNVDPATKTQTWMPIEGGVFTIGEIPLVRFATGRRKQATFIYDPALRSVVDMQITAYQQESYLEQIMTMTCFPMLSGNGVDGDPNEPVPVGPRSVLFAPTQPNGQHGSWGYIEPAGTSITLSMNRLAKTQDDLRELGKQPLVQQSLTVITTGQVAVKANSAVQAWAIRFKDSVEQAFKFTADWLKIDYEGEVKIHTDFNALMDDGKGFEGVLKLLDAGAISPDAAIDAAVRYNYLPDTFDKKDDKLLLAKHQAEQSLLTPEVPIDPLTGKPLPPPRTPPARVPPRPPVLGPKPPLQ